MRDLFGNPLPEHAPKRRPQQSPHAWPPGSGPLNRTCADCQHCVTLHIVRTVRRCALMQRYWSKLAKPDIRPNDPACLKWVAKRKEPPL